MILKSDIDEDPFAVFSEWAEKADDAAYGAWKSAHAFAADDEAASAL